MFARWPYQRLFISVLKRTMWIEVTKRITKPNLWIAPTGIHISSRQTDFFVVVVISLMRSIVSFHFLWNFLLLGQFVFIMLGLIQLDLGPFWYHAAQLVLQQFMAHIVKNATSSLDIIIYDIEHVEVASKCAIIHPENTTTKTTTNVNLAIYTFTYSIFSVFIF